MIGSHIYRVFFLSKYKKTLFRKKLFVYYNDVILKSLKNLKISKNK